MSSIDRSPIDLYIARQLNRTPETFSPEDVTDYQLEKIRALIRRLKEHSRYYAETLSEVDPDTILTMEDLRKLPLTSEQDLAENEYRFQCVSPGVVERIITVPTTGTHGRKKRIGFTIPDLKLALHFSYIAFTTFCKQGDRLLVFMSGNTAGGVGDSIRRSLEPLNAETYVYGAVNNIPDAFHFMEEYRPDIVVGIPCQMAALAEYGRLTGSSFTVRNVLLSSDDVPDAICGRLRRCWNCEPFRHFGMTELCLMGGCECHAHRGYHMRSLDHFFEVIDPDEKGYGELAITTFSHEAMPLLRYRTGDIAKMGEGPCVCGAVSPRIENVKGRRSNSFLCKSRRIFIRDIEETVFSFDGIIDFECSLHDDVLQIDLRTLPGVSADPEPVRDALCRLTEDAVSVKITSSEMTDFIYEYNAKKTLL